MDDNFGGREGGRDRERECVCVCVWCGGVGWGNVTIGSLESLRENPNVTTLVAIKYTVLCCSILYYAVVYCTML